jgi:lysophospholipase L1-like esterase
VRWGIVGLVVVGLLAGGAGVVFGGGSPVEASNRRALVVGDSIAETLVYPWARQALRPIAEPTVRSHRCRRTTAPSPCNGASVSTLAELQRLRGRVGHAVVVVSGYNDASDTGAVFGSRVDQILHEITRHNGAVPVIWPTLANGTGRHSAQNRALRAAAARWPTLRVPDWAAVSSGKHTWFVDGIHLTAPGAQAFVNLVTRELATALGPKTTALPAGPFAYGSRGEGVRAIQVFLRSQGYDVGRPDGVFGPRTDAAVRAFQTRARATGLLRSRVDGVWGPHTRRAALAVTPRA